MRAAHQQAAQARVSAYKLTDDGQGAQHLTSLNVKGDLERVSKIEGPRGRRGAHLGQALRKGSDTLRVNLAMRPRQQHGGH